MRFSFFDHRDKKVKDLIKIANKHDRRQNPADQPQKLNVHKNPPILACCKKFYSRRAAPAIALAYNTRRRPYIFESLILFLERKSIKKIFKPALDPLLFQAFRPVTLPRF
ncbi:MAG: hypothetical protein NC319_01385 [Butyricicoccus sp.]|nr:hypothetical protein [Butyricicoccus sp.]